MFVRPGADEAELVRIGRYFCAAMAILTIAWLPVIDLLSDQVFTYIQSISMYLAPPIVTVYMLGVLWWRANAQGAIAAFAVGYTLGFGRMAAEIISKVVPPPPGSFFEGFVALNYLYVGVALFTTCVLTHVLVSIATPRPAQSQVHGLVVDWDLRRALRRAVATPVLRSHPVATACASGCYGSGDVKCRAAAKGKLPMLSAAASADPSTSAHTEAAGGRDGAVCAEAALPADAAGAAGAAGSGHAVGRGGEACRVASAPALELTAREVAARQSSEAPAATKVEMVEVSLGDSGGAAAGASARDSAPRAASAGQARALLPTCGGWCVSKCFAHFNVINNTLAACLLVVIVSLIAAYM